MGLFSRKPKQEEREVWTDPLSLGGLMEQLQYAGNTYLGGGSLYQGEESVGAGFRGMVEGTYQRNGVVFACIAARMLIFSEARFLFQRLVKGRPGDLFGTQDLGLLETPWQNGTTGDLLARMLLDVDLAGNSYVRRVVKPGLPPRLQRLRPDWVTVVCGTDGDPNEGELLGYVYTPGGLSSGNDPETLLAAEVAHFAPYPDPMGHFIGMSWLTPLMREIRADSAAMAHKEMFFQKGATPNMVVTLGGDLTQEAFEAWVQKFRTQHESVANAYKTLFLTAGTNAEVVGGDMKQLDFKVTQGHGETRICAAARIPPIIVGVSEGLDAATYSNYQLAKRAFADGTLRPLWRNVAASLASLVPVQSGTRLWYDDRDIQFLQEDQKDLAEIMSIRATTAKVLVDSGFTPDSVVATIQADDFGLLAHTGLFSVQLLPATSIKGNVVKGEAVPTANDPNQGKAGPTGGTGNAPPEKVVPKPSTNGAPK